MSSPYLTIPENNVVLFNAATTGTAPAQDVSSFRQIIVAVTAPLNATLTLKFQGSIGKSVSSQAAPDFSSAQAVDNHWDYLAFYEYQNPSSVVAGDTGVVIDNTSVAENTRLFIVNVSLVRWFSATITSRTDGTVSSWFVASPL